MPVNFVEMFTCYVCHDMVGRFLFILLRRWSVLPAHMWVAVNLRIWPNNLYFVGNEVYEWAVVICFVREHDGICLYLKAYSTDLYVALARA